MAAAPCRERRPYMPRGKPAKPRKPRALTREQIRFAHYVVAGLTLTESYLRAYKGKDDLAQGTQWNNASRTAKLPQVAALIEQLQKEIHDAAVADRAEKLRILEAQLRDPDLPPRERREAIKLHNEMTGDHAPIKHEVSIDLDLAQRIRATRQ